MRLSKTSMRWGLGLTALFAVAVASFAIATNSGTVRATAETQVPIFEDAEPDDPFSLEIANFVGPTIDHSRVNYSQQDSTGDLMLEIHIQKGGVSKTEYKVFVVCGAGAHSGVGTCLAGPGSLFVGTLAMNQVGTSVSGTIFVPKCDVADVVAGGNNAGHIDIGEPPTLANPFFDLGLLVADNIVFDPSIGPPCA